jgi:hypothetical protein
MRPSLPAFLALQRHPVVLATKEGPHSLPLPDLPDVPVTVCTPRTIYGYGPQSLEWRHTCLSVIVTYIFFALSCSRGAWASAD